MVKPLNMNQVNNMLYGDAQGMLNDMRQFPPLPNVNNNTGFRGFPLQGQNFDLNPYDLQRIASGNWYNTRKVNGRMKRTEHPIDRRQRMGRTSYSMQAQNPPSFADAVRMQGGQANALQRQRQGEMGRNFYEEYANANLDNLRNGLVTEPPGGPLLGMGNAGEAFAEGAMNGLLGTPISGPETSLGRVGLGGGGGGGFRNTNSSQYITSLGDVPKPDTPKDLGGGGDNGGGGGGGTGLWDGIKGMGAEGWANVIGGANALGNMYLGHQSLKLGKQRFNFEAGLARRNLANQAQMYNSAIERRARSNAASFGYEGQERDSYVDGIVDKEKVKGTI